MSRLASKIEAILYLKGQPLPVAKIAEYAGSSRDQVEEGLIELMNDYAHRDGALEVIETSDGFCLQLRQEFQDLVHTLVPVDLGLGALRTLAAIALRGPMTLTQLVEVRGSGAYQHVQELVDMGFVRKRRKADSRSSWLQVTDKFFQYFQVDQLPKAFQLTTTSQEEDDPPDNSLEQISSVSESGG